MISIVLGTFFGDEGKGQTVHNLCNKYIGKRESVLVVRFSGGHQVGHTVKHGDMMHTFSNFGSGTLLGVPTYWSEYCTVDPITSMLEGADLAKMGVRPIVQYHPHCQVVIPFDVYSQVNNEENLRHGTVGTGFKACLDRVKAGYSLTVVDCMNPYILREKLNAIVDNYYNMSSKYPSIDLDNWCRLAHAYFLHTGTVNEDCLLNYDNLVFEGSQGILLDQRFGIMPYCTPSNTTSQNAYELLRKAGIRKEIQTCYVTRPYITRMVTAHFLLECLLGMSMTLIISSTISRRRLGLLISTKTYSHTVYALTVHLKFLIGMNERRNCTYHIGMKHLTQSKKC